MLEHVPAILGEALKSVRSGLDGILSHADFKAAAETIAVESDAFGHGAPIPSDFTEDGRKVSFPVRWSNVPAGTACLILVIEDADSPTPHPLVHAIVLDLPARDGALPEAALKSPGNPGQPHVLGQNSFMKAEYLPPDPPSGHGAHRYVVQVFALDRPIDLAGEPGRGALTDAMRDHVLAKGLLIGTYERP